MIEIRDPNDPLPRQNGAIAAVVVDRDDPRGLGRIRVRVPGMYDKSPWALPLGTLGAGPNIGGWWIPENGSEVVILLGRGDPDHPYYITSNWTVDSVPEEARVNGKGDPDIRVIASGDFAMVFDERAASKKFQLIHRPSGDVIEYDGIIRQWSIAATTSVAIQAVGQVDIQAAVITLNGRVVLPTGEPI